MDTNGWMHQRNTEGELLPVEADTKFGKVKFKPLSRPELRTLGDKNLDDLDKVVYDHLVEPKIDAKDWPFLRADVFLELQKALHKISGIGKDPN